MIKLTHNDDGKRKWKSHTISISEDDFKNYELGVYSHNPFEIEGYGATKEKALEDFMKKFKYIMEEWFAFEMMLFDSNVITDNIVEVDCFGKPIE